MEEEWKDIEGYEGIYQASSLGRIRRTTRRYDSIRKDKRIERVLKPKWAGKGYRSVCLSKKHKERYLYIHRLVAKAFVPNPNDLPEVNHINGDKTDNRTSNLEWVTKSENHLHASRIGIAHRGEMCGTSKLTEEQAIQIRELASSGEYYLRELGEIFGVSYATIGGILRNENWSHLGPPIDIRKQQVGTPKITREIADEIRTLYSTGDYLYKDLAQMYGIKKSQVGNIITRKCWN